MYTARFFLINNNRRRSVETRTHLQKSDVFIFTFWNLNHMTSYFRNRNCLFHKEIYSDLVYRKNISFFRIYRISNLSFKEKNKALFYSIIICLSKTSVMNHIIWLCAALQMISCSKTLDIKSLNPLTDKPMIIRSLSSTL